MKPGNSGGGKDPDFWCAFEDGEVEVIGEEPANTIERQDPSGIAVSCGEGAKPTAQKKHACGLFLPVGLTVKPVAEPDAGNRHGPFDERGWGTEGEPSAPSTGAHTRPY